MPFGNLDIPTYKATKDFSLPFEVKKGEILYLGDMIIDIKKFIKSGNLIHWVDNSERELSEFKEKFPKIDWELFRNHTIREGQIENEKLINFGK